MAIATKLKDYLTDHGIHYDIVTHRKSHNSIQSALFAHVPPECVAKSVILEDENGYVMAVLPSSHHVRLGVLSRDMQRKLRLATEQELVSLFQDCDVGAAPPLGELYGLPAVVDESIMQMPDIYFEAGDHEELIHVDGPAFTAMMMTAQRGKFSQRMSITTEGIARREPMPERRMDYDY